MILKFRTEFLNEIKKSLGAVSSEDMQNEIQYYSLGKAEIRKNRDKNTCS